MTRWTAEKLRSALSDPSSNDFRKAMDDLQQAAMRRRAEAEANKPKQITGPETPPGEPPAATPTAPTEPPPAPVAPETRPAAAKAPEVPPMPVHPPVSPEVQAAEQATPPAPEKPVATADKPLPIEKPGDLEQAAQTAEQPKSPAEAEAGNYQKAHVEVGGLPIAIETPKGAARTGIAPDGTIWSADMPFDYGHIKGTKGADSDPLDVTIGPLAHEAANLPVTVIQQHEPGSAVGKVGEFDENKSFIGFPSEAEAVTAYLGSFSDNSGPARIGQVRTMPFDEFKAWAHSDGAAKPLPKEERPAIVPAAAPGGAGAPPAPAEHTETPTETPEQKPAPEEAKAPEKPGEPALAVPLPTPAEAAAETAPKPVENGLPTSSFEGAAESVPVAGAPNSGIEVRHRAPYQDRRPYPCRQADRREAVQGGLRPAQSQGDQGRRSVEQLQGQRRGPGLSLQERSGGAEVHRRKWWESAGRHRAGRSSERAWGPHRQAARRSREEAAAQGRLGADRPQQRRQPAL